MNDNPNPDPENDKGPLISLLWVAVGLAPIFILLAAISSPGRRVSLEVILIICAVCNLLGGIGCLRHIKQLELRIILGIFLAGFFFVLSWGVALFQACSHMGSI